VEDISVGGVPAISVYVSKVVGVALFMPALLGKGFNSMVDGRLRASRVIHGSRNTISFSVTECCKFRVESRAQADVALSAYGTR